MEKISITYSFKGAIKFQGLSRIWKIVPNTRFWSVRRDPTFALYEQCITIFSLHERPFMVALLFVVGARR